MKWTLVLLSVPAALVAFGYLVVGLTFGFNLWRVDRPFAIAMWFAVLLFPAFLVATIRSSERPRRFWALTAAAWCFAAFWAYWNFLWMPWTYGGPWGW